MNAVGRNGRHKQMGLAARADIYRTTDGGSTWTPFLGGANICDINVFTVTLKWNPNRENDAWFFGLTPGLGYTFLLHTTDAGISWRLTDLEGLGLGDFRGISKLVFDALDSNTVFLAVPPMTLKSTDNGSNWFLIQPQLSVIASHPSIHDRVFFSGPKGVYVSNDGGETLTFLTQRSGLALASIVIDPVTGALFYGSSTGVYKYVQ
jgi:photosystem II stability/assembly factor-like uncharacterized protein